MRRSLTVLLLLFACDDAPEPATHIPETSAAEPTAAEAVETAVETAPPTETPEANDDPEPAGDNVGENEAGPKDEIAAPLALDGTLITTPHPDAHVELTGRINRAGILRLTRALGLPAPLHVHGRPLAVPGGEQVISLVSFLSPGESDARDERLTDMSVDQMHTEVWLLERTDGSLFRVGAARIPYQPVPSYNEIAVDAEGIGDALSIKAQNIEDFDEDGAMEYQLVVELIDAVEGGIGPMTHRYAMIFNLPAMTTALNIQTFESALEDTYSRSAILWGDQNDDDHPDITVRVRRCREWSEEGCVRETNASVSYLWQPEHDRWDPMGDVPGAAPSDGEE